MAITSLQQLHNILQTEQTTVSQLLELLIAERQLLIASDTDAMETMSAKKQPLVIALEKLGRQREAVLQSEGFSADKEGLEAFIANQTDKDSQALNDILQDLRKMAHACRDSNQINGGIVNVNRQYIQRAMDIMRGRDLDASSYGPGGEYSSQVVRQPLLGRV